MRRVDAPLAPHFKFLTTREGVRGIGSGLEIVVSEVPGLDTTELQTAFSLTYSAKGWFWGAYKPRFSGEVPANLVRHVGNTFVIAVGQIGIDPKFLEKNDKFEISISIQRKLGEHGRNIDLNGKFRVPKQG